MKRRLCWKITKEDGDSVTEFTAKFKVNVSESSCLDINYYVCKNGESWYLGIVEVNPDNSVTHSTVKCYDQCTGKQMAEDSLQRIIDRVKPILYK